MFQCLGIFTRHLSIYSPQLINLVFVVYFSLVLVVKIGKRAAGTISIFKLYFFFVLLVLSRGLLPSLSLNWAISTKPKRPRTALSSTLALGESTSMSKADHRSQLHTELDHHHGDESCKHLRVEDDVEVVRPPEVSPIPLLCVRG